MTWAEVSGLLTALTLILGMVGRGIAWLLDFVLKQANATIASQQEEIKAKDSRIDLLEEALRTAGVPIPQ